MAEPGWVDVGNAQGLAARPLQTELAGRTRIAARAVDMSRVLLASTLEDRRLERRGRKASGPARRVEE